ncbi:hypothetical protein EYF80_053786 [Liparis tanakae]|uniref:Uncharacterized protein n=1 Tax=Liparis tanakae TaxID=230148 RepID=A0A4Z2F568_9TELE|nr:hypothetical protein EYF80_053786 [Liparis tanakae]
MTFCLLAQGVIASVTCRVRGRVHSNCARRHVGDALVTFTAKPEASPTDTEKLRHPAAESRAAASRARAPAARQRGPAAAERSRSTWDILLLRPARRVFVRPPVETHRHLRRRDAVTGVQDMSGERTGVWGCHGLRTSEERTREER